MKSKKNTDPKADQKRLFMRMRSPSAFGAARRFDSASFMNVPPEMARRDAAYVCFSKYFQSCDLKGKTAEDRVALYARILKLFDLIEAKSEFILNSDMIEKRNLENAESLAFVRLVKTYFITLQSLACAQTGELVPKRAEESLVSGRFYDRLNPQLFRHEKALIDVVRKLLLEKREMLQAQMAQRCKHFSKSDSERYERAYALYAEYYTDLENV